jgi:hypothetical protein
MAPHFYELFRNVGHESLLGECLACHDWAFQDWSRGRPAQRREVARLRDNENDEKNRKANEHNRQIRK